MVITSSLGRRDTCHLPSTVLGLFFQSFMETENDLLLLFSDQHAEASTGQWTSL